MTRGQLSRQFHPQALSSQCSAPYKAVTASFGGRGGGESSKGNDLCHTLLEETETALQNPIAFFFFFTI